MDYTPHTEEEIQAMLEKVGVETLEDLYAHLPEEILNPPIHLPDPMPEWAVLEELSRLAGETFPPERPFWGAGPASTTFPPWSRPWGAGASS
jgi:glycine dehydrogenase subunit 1